MPKRRPSPVHLGGPLGLAGVTLLASAVGLVVVANDSRDSRQSGAGQKQTAEQTATDSRPPAGSVGVEQLRPAPAAGDAHALPAAATKDSSSVGADVTFIVRLKGRPEIDTICRNYKRDRAAAEAAFADLAAEIPTLRDFRLVGASYSGEINLTYRLPPGVEPTRGQIEDIRKRILSIDGVAYADPDFVAHPGEDKRK